MLHIFTDFNPLHCIINRELHEKHIQPFMENFWSSNCAPQLSIKIVSVSLDHDVSQHFFSNTVGNIPSKEKNRVRSVPASTALSQVSHWSHNAYTANYHGSGERNGEPLVEPWYKHWSCCDWWKSISQAEATLISEKIKPLAIASVELHLSEGISKWVI